jgi:hypothetical protein
MRVAAVAVALLAVGCTSSNGSRTATTLTREPAATSTTVATPNDVQRYISTVKKSYIPYHSAFARAFDPCFAARANVTLCKPKLVEVIATGMALLARLAGLKAPASISTTASAFGAAVRADVKADQQLLAVTDRNDAAAFMRTGPTVGHALLAFCERLIAMQSAGPDVGLAHGFCS